MTTDPDAWTDTNGAAWDTTKWDTSPRVGPEPLHVDQAITLPAPWPAALAARICDIVNLPYRTAYLGPVVVHVDNRRIPPGYAHNTLRILSTDMPRDQTRLFNAYNTWEMSYVCAGRIVDCHWSTGDCCRPWGRPDRAHWRFDDIRSFPHPVPAVGHPGLRRIPTMVTSPIDAQTATIRE